MKMKFNAVILIITFLALGLSGCATVPRNDGLIYTRLNGTMYLPAVNLCRINNVKFDFDAFTRTASLTQDNHVINLMAGEKFVVIDGQKKILNAAPIFHEGMFLVSRRFKDELFDPLFKKDLPGHEQVFFNFKKIVIDAGHGGNDPGAIGKSGLREKDVNLDITTRLVKLLKQQGVEVVTTRSTDKFIPLEERAKIANKLGADLFVSIHANANRARSLNGFEVYYLTPGLSDWRRAQEIAKEINLDIDPQYLAQDSKTLRVILTDLYCTDSREESLRLGRVLCRQVTKELDTKVLGVKTANFAVLREVYMPSVLIEVGFLSNGNEERLLKNNYYRQRMAELIFSGLKDYSATL